MKKDHSDHFCAMEFVLLNCNYFKVASIICFRDNNLLQTIQKSHVKYMRVCLRFLFVLQKLQGTFARKNQLGDERTP